MTHSYPPRRSTDLHEPARGQALELRRVRVDRRHQGAAAIYRLCTGPDRQDQRVDDADPERTGRGDRQAAGERGRTQVRARQSRSEEHTSELQSLMRSSYAVFCLKNTKTRMIECIKNSVDWLHKRNI